MGSIVALAGAMKKIFARKTLHLDRETLRPLHRTALAASRGGRRYDDGTMSGFPVCNTYYPSACTRCDTDDCDTSALCD